MKRLLGWVLATFLILASLSACATPTRQREPATITFACRDYQRDEYEELARAFSEEHTHITVQILSTDEILERSSQGGAVTVSSDDIYKLAQAADTFVESPWMLGEHPQDAVLDLSEWVAHDDAFSWDDFYPGALAPFRRGEKLWGLPFEVHTFFLYYDRAALDQAGVPHPEVGWTWDDLLDAAARLTLRRGEIVERYGYVDNGSPALLQLTHQAAGGLIETEHEIQRARLAEPEVAHAVRWYADLVREHAVMPDPGQDSGTLHRVVYDESPAMWTGGSWEWNNFRDKAGVVPLPERDGTAAATLQVRGYLISAGTAYPQEAWRWIEWLTHQPPSRYSSGAPARRSVAEATDHWAGRDEALAAAFTYNLEHAVDYPGYLLAALSRALQAALQGGSVEDALDEGQAQVNERLSAAERPPGQVTVAAPETTPAPSEDGDRTPIRFLVLYAGDRETFRPLIEQFHAEQDAVHVELGSGSDGSLAARAAEADCFLGPTSDLDGATGALLALDPLIAADPGFNLDLYYPIYLDRVRRDGELWGLPLDSDAYLLYYDLEQFDRAGLAYPTADWTPQALVEAALSLADAGADAPVYGFYPRHGALVDGALYVAWLGGQLFDADGRPTLNHPTVIEATRAYAGLIAGASPPRALERSGDRLAGVTLTSVQSDRPQLRRPGDDVAMWSGDYDSNRRAPELGAEVGVVPFPVGEAGFWAMDRALYISRNTAHPQACWSWMRYLAAQPQALHHLPVRRDLAQGEEWSREAGEALAEAWRATLAQEQAALPGWYSDRTANRALYWFDEALEEVLVGAPAAAVLHDAQGKALAFVECVGAQADDQSWCECAQQADPDVVLPQQ